MAETQTQKRVVLCEDCGARARVPSGQRVRYVCPRCHSPQDVMPEGAAPGGDGAWAVRGPARVDVRALRHPTETSRLVLAAFAVVPVMLLYLVLVWVLPVLVGLVWFGTRVARARFLGHAVKVYANNFPDIHRVATDVKARLGYEGALDVYIVEDGSIDAVLAKFFSTKYIVLHSGMAEAVRTEGGLKEVEFIVARFVGALKAKHTRTSFVSFLINSTENLKVLNLLVYPYERAVQYSGDQIGLAVCGDLTSAVNAFTRMMVGSGLHRDVNPSSILYQCDEVENLFGLVARLYSRHPPMVSRYANLLAFARQRYPDLYEDYLSGQSEALRSQLDVALRRITAYR